MRTSNTSMTYSNPLQVTLKLRQCEFFTQEIKYLGHIIIPGTLEVDQARVAALKEVKYPTYQTQLRSFFGLCNVYRRYIKDLTHVAHPLNKLLRKGEPVKLKLFGYAEIDAFHKLKEAILSPPFLVMPKPGLSYSVDTDASVKKRGAALFQTYPDGGRKPTGFFSRTLLPAERNYSVSEAEFLAVVWALDL